MKNVTSLVDEIIAGKSYVLIPEVLKPTQAQEGRSLLLQLAEKEKRKEKFCLTNKENEYTA